MLTPQRQRVVDRKTIQEQPINEFFPGTLMDVGKKPGDVWQLFLSEKWAAIGPQGFRMSYIIKKDAEIWAKTGKDDFGNDENELKQDISWDEPEHQESRINPDLEEGDIIRVIDIDGEHANMPKRWGIYKVYGVMGLGGSQEPYYQLSGETAELIQDRLMNAKYLYPGDTWIPADTPMATKVDRKTISEHKESKLNPELMVGDEVLVTGTENIVNAPELYMPYVVVDIKQSNNTQEKYYGLDLLDPPDLETAVDQQIRIKDLHLHQEDSWIFNPGFKREETITKPKNSKLNPQLMMGDEIMVVSSDGIHDFGAPELYKPYVVVGIKHGTTMNREIHKWTHDEDEEQTPDRSQYPPELQARSRLGFRKEFDTIPYTYYQIEPIGMTDEERNRCYVSWRWTHETNVYFSYT